MKILSTTGLTKLIELIKSSFIKTEDVVETTAIDLATVAISGLYNDLTGKPDIPSVINDVVSTSTTDALSANMGKELQDQVTNLKARGRYLSVWNSTTGLAMTTPVSPLPYDYKAGDYFIVGTVGTTNYKPTGAQYTGTASTTQETGTVNVNDTYYYDGNTWSLLSGGGQVTATFASLSGSPSDNSNLASALNAKAPLKSPTLTGTPKAPTATAGTNTTQIATTAFTTTAINNKIQLVNTLPENPVEGVLYLIPEA